MNKSIATIMVLVSSLSLSGCATAQLPTKDFDVAAAVACDFPEIKAMYPKFGPPPVPEENTPERGNCWADDINPETAGFNQGYLTLGWQTLSESKSFSDDVNYAEKGSFGNCEYGFRVNRQSTTDDARVNTISALCDSNFVVYLDAMFDGARAKELLNIAITRLSAGG